MFGRTLLFGATVAPATQAFPPAASRTRAGAPLLSGATLRRPRPFRGRVRSCDTARSSLPALTPYVSPYSAPCTSTGRRRARGDGASAWTASKLLSYAPFTTAPGARMTLHLSSCLDPLPSRSTSLGQCIGPLIPYVFSMRRYVDCVQFAIHALVQSAPQPPHLFRQGFIRSRLGTPGLPPHR